MSINASNPNSVRSHENANNDPAVVANGGEREIASTRRTIVDALAAPDAAKIEFEPPRLGDELVRPADLT